MTAIPKQALQKSSWKCSVFSATLYTKVMKFHVIESVSDTKKATKKEDMY